MKRTVVFIFLFSFFSGLSVFADNPIALQNPKDQPTIPPPYPRVKGFHPISAFTNETDLYVIFETSLGIVDITITDENGNIVTLETLDTSIDTELFIPIDTFTSGDYTLQIEYESTIVEGNFTIQ